MSGGATLYEKPPKKSVAASEEVGLWVGHFHGETPIAIYFKTIAADDLFVLACHEKPCREKKQRLRVIP